MSMYDSSHKKSQHLTALALLALITSLGLFIDFLMEEPRLPVVDQDELLGFRPKDNSINQYVINITDSMVSSIMSQVKHSAILSKPLKDTFGLDMQMYIDVISHWMENYDWRSREMYFNRYPQYTTIIQGLQIHFVHIKPTTNKKIVPILMLHGWPDSFAIFYDIVPQLIDGEAEISFELIIPSLPGYFMSDAIGAKGKNSIHVASIFKNLMRRLDIDKFYVFGQDWGSVIATDMAILYSDNVLGLYNTLCISLRKISLVKYLLEGSVNNVVNVDRSKYPVSKGAEKVFYHLNFMHKHFTSPDSMSITLMDSPITLASYVWHLMSMATDVDEYGTQLYGAFHRLNTTKLIDTIMLILVSETTASTLRSYQQYVVMPLYQHPVSSKVPCSCPKIEKEMFYQPDWIYRDKFRNVVQATTLDEGGHYMLLETDFKDKNKFVNDLIQSVKRMIDFHSA